MGTVVFWGWWKYSKLKLWCCLHTLNMLKTTELYILSEWPESYENYIPMMLFFKMRIFLSIHKEISLPLCPDTHTHTQCKSWGFPSNTSTSSPGRMTSTGIYLRCLISSALCPLPHLVEWVIVYCLNNHNSFQKFLLQASCFHSLQTTPHCLHSCLPKAHALKDVPKFPHNSQNQVQNP